MRGHIVFVKMISCVLVRGGSANGWEWLSNYFDKSMPERYKQWYVLSHTEFDAMVAEAYKDKLIATEKAIGKVRL